MARRSWQATRNSQRSKAVAKTITSSRTPWAVSLEGRTRDELWTILSSFGLSSAPVRTVGEAIADPHLEERGAFSEVDHPTAGKVKISSPWVRFSRTPSGKPAPAPLRGQHNHEVLRSVLGLSESEIAALERKGVVEPPAARPGTPVVARLARLTLGIAYVS